MGVTPFDGALGLPAGSARFTEDDLLPISALQHLLFCERQCALIHVEGQWAENRLTVEGRHLHEKSDNAPSETRAGMRIARHLALRSFMLGLAGRADVVEFYTSGESAGEERVFPVEYKRGRPKQNDADRVQLCAQAMCLEEMLGVAVPAGALFYGTPRRRTDVVFDDPLRATTALSAARLHAMVGAAITPPAVREPKCESCSLIHLCLPDALGRRYSVDAYMQHAIEGSLRDVGAGEVRT